MFVQKKVTDEVSDDESDSEGINERQFVKNRSSAMRTGKIQSISSSSETEDSETETEQSDSEAESEKVKVHFGKLLKLDVITSFRAVFFFSGKFCFPERSQFLLFSAI